MTDRDTAPRAILRLRVAAAASAIILLRFALPADAAPADVSGLIHVCSSCHGPGGISVNTANFPNLAGQQQQYLATQLRAFRNRTRADPHARTYMWGMAARLTDAQIEAIAEYYSRQRPQPGRPDNSAEAQAGRQLYDAGIAAKGVPPCQACHGEHAEGNAVIPRLAGQHREYIARELTEFANLARANEVMHENAKNLTPAEIGALAAFVAAQ